jgi:hypothetical protein
VSSQQETMRTTTAAAGVKQQNDLIAANAVCVNAVAAAGPSSGYIPGFPSGNVAYCASVQAAASALTATRMVAEQAKQSAITVAKDVLRTATGEIPF